MLSGQVRNSGDEEWDGIPNVKPGWPRGVDDLSRNDDVRAQTTAAVASRMFARARDAGVNFIDTADAYADGASERVVGRCIKRDRHDWVLATKFGAGFKPGPNQRGVTRKRLMQQIDSSLARLGTDFIDIYYIHVDDQATPLPKRSARWAMSSARARRATSGSAISAAGGSPKSSDYATRLGSIDRSRASRSTMR